MLVAYTPALVAMLASFAVPGSVDGPRARLLAAALAVHFLKQVLEVLFVHRNREHAARHGCQAPRGGLFELVTCPQYLFEIFVFLGFAVIGQIVFALAVAVCVAAYHTGRSWATWRWYAAKFEEFPGEGQSSCAVCPVPS
ncbi:hypothetical protein EJB05_15016, partial [Eragrostis curvula]